MVCHPWRLATWGPPAKRPTRICMLTYKACREHYSTSSASPTTGKPLKSLTLTPSGEAPTDLRPGWPNSPQS
eukprot:1607310-Amphidinium_carterae.2